MDLDRNNRTCGHGWEEVAQFPGQTADLGGGRGGGGWGLAKKLEWSFWGGFIPQCTLWNGHEVKLWNKCITMLQNVYLASYSRCKFYVFFYVFYKTNV